MNLTKEYLIEINACQPGVDWFTKNFDDNANLKDVFIKLVDVGKHDYCKWLLRYDKRIDLKIKINLAIFSAELVLPIWLKNNPKDDRPQKAIEAAKKCVENPTKENKDAATAAGAAAAYDAAYAAAYADYAAAAYAAADAAAAYAYARKDTWLKIIDKLFEMLNQKKGNK